MKALVLLSGGIDSTVCAGIAVENHGAENVIAAVIEYGQKHSREISAAHNIARELKIEIINVKLEGVFNDSCLVNTSQSIPDISYDELEGVSPMYVPFRNGNFLSVATTLALENDAQLIYYGAHAEDAQGWAYPDCTPEFNGAMANAIYVGTYHRVRLVTPLQWMTKTKVVAEGIKLLVPLHLTYSCYKGNRDHCGTCATCRSRYKAFRANDIEHFDI